MRPTARIMLDSFDSENPEDYIEDFVKAGSDIITVHAESSWHLHRLIQQIKGYGVKAGVSLNPSTPICAIEQIVKDIDMVLIMTVNPGFGGQSFIENMYGKIISMKNTLLKNNSYIPIQVDGGVNLTNIRKLYECGAEIMVAGSAIFNSDNIAKTIKDMKNSVGELI